MLGNKNKGSSTFPALTMPALCHKQALTTRPVDCNQVYPQNKLSVWPRESSTLDRDVSMTLGTGTPMSARSCVRVKAGRVSSSMKEPCWLPAHFSWLEEAVHRTWTEGTNTALSASPSQHAAQLRASPGPRLARDQTVTSDLTVHHRWRLDLGIRV